MPACWTPSALSKLHIPIRPIFKLFTALTFVQRTKECFDTLPYFIGILSLIANIFCERPCYTHRMVELPTVCSITVENMEALEKISADSKPKCARKKRSRQIGRLVSTLLHERKIVGRCMPNWTNSTGPSNRPTQIGQGEINLVIVDRK